MTFTRPSSPVLLAFRAQPSYPSKAMTQIYRLWRGDLTLENAFWNWAVIGGLAINLATSAAFLFLIMADRPYLAFIARYLVSIPYNTVFLVHCLVCKVPRTHYLARPMMTFA